MPNLVVYVPAKLWSQIEALGLDDPKVEARKVAVGALEEFVGAKPHIIETDAPEDLLRVLAVPEKPPTDARAVPPQSAVGRFAVPAKSDEVTPYFKKGKK